MKFITLEYHFIWLFRWEDRLVKLWLDWDPAPDQITGMAEHQ